MLCQVYPDEVETGRVQGQLIQTLLPDGGKALYVQGSKRSLAACDRTAGHDRAMHRAVRGGPPDPHGIIA